MDVQFRLMDEKIMNVRLLGVPCEARDAKAAGRRKLEEQTGGIPVKSCQDGDGKPERNLDDDENLAHGTVLNPAGVQYLVLLKPLYRLRLQSAVSELVARFFSAPVTEESCKGGQLKEKLSSNSVLAKGIEEVLNQTGYGQSSVEEFGEGLDGNYKDRNSAQRINNDEELRAELKELHDAGVHELMEDTMPEAAHVVRHFDKFLALLPQRTRSLEGRKGRAC